MIVGQLGKVTGVPVEGDSFLAELIPSCTNLGAANLADGGALAEPARRSCWSAAGCGPRWPVPLVGMLAATAAVAVFDLQDVGITVVGAAATGLPSFAVPALSAADLPTLALAAVGVAIVGYSDNVLTARAFASRRREEIEGNTELLALGTANLAAGLLRGFPVSSSGSRTAVGNAQGSQTQLYSLTALVLVLLVLAVGGAVLAGFPDAALGAVVIFAAISLIDLPAFRRLRQVRRSELVLALATTAAVLVLGVLYGVLAAIALSVVDLLRRISRPHDGILGYVPGVPGMHDVDDYPDARPVPGLVVYRYDAPLFFANAEDFRRGALAAVRDAPTDTHWLLLNVEAVVEVDSTAIDALEALRAELADRGVVFAMARVKQDLRDDLRQAGFVDAVGEDRIFMTSAHGRCGLREVAPGTLRRTTARRPGVMRSGGRCERPCGREGRHIGVDQPCWTPRSSRTRRQCFPSGRSRRPGVAATGGRPAVSPWTRPTCHPDPRRSGVGRRRAPSGRGIPGGRRRPGRPDVLERHGDRSRATAARAGAGADGGGRHRAGDRRVEPSYGWRLGGLGDLFRFDNCGFVGGGHAKRGGRWEGARQMAADDETRPTTGWLHRFDRWMYRWTPDRLARLLNRLSALQFATGLFPDRLVTLEVPGRRSGRPISFPLVVAD